VTISPNDIRINLVVQQAFYLLYSDTNCDFFLKTTVFFVIVPVCWR
jgi:hypothetical protein